jgi:hypothetical protein
MSLARQFQTAVTDAVAQGGTTADLLPMVFAQAAVAVLPVEGAGLSMTDHLRIPSPPPISMSSPGSGCRP